MRIKSLTLHNFRNIGEAATQYFDDHFTAVIGINGKGKSTWLQAMRIACGAYFLGISHVQSRHITEDEIRKTYKNGLILDNTPVKVEAEGFFPELGQNPITWRRAIPQGKLKTTSNDADVGNVRALGKAKFDKMNHAQTTELDLPLVAYFGTSRVFGAARNTAKNPNSLGKQIFKDGYENWFEMRANAYKYINWLNNYDFNLKHGREYQGTKDAFFDCLKIGNRYIDSIEFQNTLWLRVTKKSYHYTSQLLPLQFHSDGVIALTDMLAELAYRCIVLNGYKGPNAIKETKGVVMIDELDLHLHPSWQKHIAADLKAAFPNIQFVVTTHSPFIVQSLNSQEIINLDHSQLPNPPNKSSLEEVAEYEMGVPNPQRSQKFIDMQTAAAEFFQLVKAGEKDKTKIAAAKQKLDKLRTLYGTDPAYIALLETQLFHADK